MEHDWRALLQYKLTNREAEQMVRGYGHPEVDDAPVTLLASGETPAVGDPRVFLGTHNLLNDETVVLCYVCELAWDPELAKQPCLGHSALPADLGEILGGPKPPIGNVNLGLGEVGRNDPCPCGSGKKFKRCHGSN